MRVFDTHCHLAGDELFPRAEALAKDAFDNGVKGMALISADAESLRSIGTLGAKLRSILPDAVIVETAGLHPHDTSKIDDSLWDELVAAAARPAVRAIGETGLDYFYEHSNPEIQKEYFEKHIALACELQKPLVIHCRKAAEDVLYFLKSDNLKKHSNPGILHCFTEDIYVARVLLDLNFYISFSGIFTFKNAGALREIVKFVPLDRALIETDSPWLAPEPHRGKPNEPKFVLDVYKRFLELRTEDAKVVETTLWQNSCKVYGVPFG